jgi:putative transposase
MASRERSQRIYDHRLRELVRRTGDPRLAIDLGVPRSTAMGWVSGEAQSVVSLDVLDKAAVDLQAEVLKLRRRVPTLSAIVRLLMTLLRISGFQLERAHVLNPRTRAVILRAAERADSALPKRAVLRILGISATRYGVWQRAERGCDVEDQVSCLRSVPNQLTAGEVATIKSMVTDERFRHVPTGRLAVLAQRLGKVFASPSTWYRLVRDRDWRRPRVRRHPESPKQGIRAKGPDEIWHIDTSSVRLLDGTKVWLHAVIDNFSRKVLAWRVANRFEIANTVEVLEDAVQSAVTRDRQPELMADGGVENYNEKVDHLEEQGMLRRVRALVDVRFSNSMIESWWHTLKHQWLYLHPLESVAAVRRYVAFYVSEYNARIPHAAFQGQTPDEMYYGRGEAIPIDLESARREARRRRLAANRAASCGRCPPSEEVAA